MLSEKKRLWKKLVWLHHSNAWIFLFLAVTGIILYLPLLRPVLTVVRVWIRDVHIIIGFLSCVVVLLYTPAFKKHMKQLGKKMNQKVNVYIVLFILGGLFSTGFILTYHRQFPVGWNAAALFLHDLFTWAGIPYVLYHAVSRSKWIKRFRKQKKKDMPYLIEKENPVINRRKFVQIAGGSALFLVTAPFIVKLVKPGFVPWTFTNGQSEYQMLPEPKAAYPLKGGAGDGRFRPYTVTTIPSFTAENWSFTVDGLVERPLSYTWSEFLALPRKVQVSDFHCVTGWSVNHVTWEGIPLHEFLDLVGVQEEATYVKLYSGDGVYTDSLTLDQAHMEDIMVALLIDGEPIDQDYGGPVRLIVPKMYAYKSVKWLTRVELIAEDHVGYWEQRGYSKDAWI